MPRIEDDYPLMGAWLTSLRARTSPSQFNYGRAARLEGVSRFTLTPGLAKAQVAAAGSNYTATQGEWRKTTLWLATSDWAWQQIVTAFRADASYIIDLQAGRLTDELADLFERVRVSLYPNLDLLSVDCACGSAERFCRHVIALCYRFAAAVEEDAFALLTLHGRSRAQLLSALGLGDPPPDISRQYQPLAADYDEYWQLTSPLPQFATEGGTYAGAPPGLIILPADDSEGYALHRKLLPTYTLLGAWAASQLAAAVPPPAPPVRQRRSQ